MRMDQFLFQYGTNISWTQNFVPEEDGVPAGEFAGDEADQLQIMC